MRRGQRAGRRYTGPAQPPPPGASIWRVHRGLQSQERDTCRRHAAVRVPESPLGRPRRRPGPGRPAGRGPCLKNPERGSLASHFLIPFPRTQHDLFCGPSSKRLGKADICSAIGEPKCLPALALLDIVSPPASPHLFGAAGPSQYKNGPLQSAGP